MAVEVKTGILCTLFLKGGEDFVTRLSEEYSIEIIKAFQDGKKYVNVSLSNGEVAEITGILFTGESFADDTRVVVFGKD